MRMTSKRFYGLFIESLTHCGHITLMLLRGEGILGNMSGFHGVVGLLIMCVALEAGSLDAGRGKVYLFEKPLSCHSVLII